MFCTHVGDEGARAIREAIQGNKGTKLASLNMAGNNIGQVGAKSVAAMVTVMVTVTGAINTHAHGVGDCSVCPLHCIVLRHHHRCRTADCMRGPAVIPSKTKARRVLGLGSIVYVDEKRLMP